MSVDSPAVGGRPWWRAERRPPPGFGHVLGAAAGGFAVVGTVIFVADVAGDGDPTAPGVGFSAALALVAVVLGFVAPGPIRSACATALVAAAPLVWLFAFVDVDDEPGRGTIRLILLLTLGSYLVLYVVPWTRARSLFLGGTLALFASWVGFEVAGSDFRLPVGADDGVRFEGTTNSTATALLIVGLVYLAIGAVLDLRRLRGAATPFLAIGAISAVGGAVVLGANESVLLAGLLAAAAGALVGLVGARGNERRATTWGGVIVVFGGLAAVLADIAPDELWGTGALAFGFAAGLGVLAMLLAAALREPDDGAERPPPPEPPEPVAPPPEPAPGEGLLRPDEPAPV